MWHAVFSSHWQCYAEGSAGNPVLSQRLRGTFLTRHWWLTLANTAVVVQWPVTAPLLLDLDTATAGHLQSQLCWAVLEGVDDTAFGTTVSGASQFVSLWISFLDLTLTGSPCLSVLPSDSLWAVIYLPLSNSGSLLLFHFDMSHSEDRFLEFQCHL